MTKPALVFAFCLASLLALPLIVAGQVGEARALQGAHHAT